jgi:hypothetical protein
LNKKQFQKYLDRDEHCPCCGVDDGTLIPNHRKNRGMGGSKERDVPSNIIVLCSDMNNYIEQSVDWRAEAVEFGWKLESWQDPLTTPFFDRSDGCWYLIDDKFNRVLDR